MYKNKGGPPKKEAKAANERIIPITIEGDDPKDSNEKVSNKNEIKVVQMGEEASTNDASEPMNNSSDSCDSLLERPIPPIHVPEKIIIILDTSLDDDYTPFEQQMGKRYNPLYMLQHALQIFIHNKHAINVDHEFALMTLNENSANWVHGFTSNPQDIIESFTSVKVCKPEDIFNMNTVFDLIIEHVCLPKIEGVATQFVVRAIFLYGRSFSLPIFTRTPEITNLLQSPVFIFDVVMTHEPPDADNHCNVIFETLQKIDTKGFSYSFSVSRNSKDLHVAMGKMLGHSLQRPLQSLINFDITQFKK